VFDYFLLDFLVRSVVGLVGTVRMGGGINGILAFEEETAL
jgi:hypothetical protein